MDYTSIFMALFIGNLKYVVKMEWKPDRSKKQKTDSITHSP